MLRLNPAVLPCLPIDLAHLAEQLVVLAPDGLLLDSLAGELPDGSHFRERSHQVRLGVGASELSRIYKAEHQTHHGSRLRGHQAEGA